VDNSKIVGKAAAPRGHEVSACWSTLPVVYLWI